MWTGRQALSNIDHAIAALHRDESGLDSALQGAMAEVGRLREERGRALRELAKVKLDELASGRLVSGLDAAERRALDLLQGRRARLARVSEARDAAAAKMHDTEARQQTMAAAVEDALAAVDALRVTTEAALAHNDQVAAARKQLADAEAVASEARAKAQTNAAELAAKKKPYDDDPLFQYLWKRGFGTSAYAHAGLTRFLDRMVASFIGYVDVRANYHMLNEIPLRLAEHADGQGALLDVYREALSRLQRQELDKAGMAALESRLAAARAKLAEADAALEKERAALASLDAQREQVLSGAGDPAYVEAIATLAANDARDDIGTLYAEARRTATRADEALVGQIERIDAGTERAEAKVTELQDTAQQLARRRAEVEQTRDRFRRSGYDHPNVVFGNEQVISDVLGGVLRGAIQGGILWDALRGGYSNRPPQSSPDFGGGFPFPMPGGFGGGNTSGGDWRDAGSSGSWSPGPDTASGGGDDFSTGGRF
jgi:prefoldin subunit 5